MTYCPCTAQVVLNTYGMLSNVYSLSLTHNTPSDLSVVLDTYKENPMNLGAKPLLEPEYNHEILIY